jgi:hypothetical protein
MPSQSSAARSVATWAASPDWMCSILMRGLLSASVQWRTRNEA